MRWAPTLLSCLLALVAGCSGGDGGKRVDLPSAPPGSRGEGAGSAGAGVAAVVLDATGRRLASVTGDGAVEHAMPDGRGGWYLSGTFTRVQDAARSGRAHLDLHGRLDRSGSAPGGTDSVVAFGRVLTGNGEEVVARELSTGRQTRGFHVTTGPDNTEGPGVRALAVAGRWLYIGGRFTKVEGVKRVGLARVDARSGRLDRSWRPPVPDTSPCSGCDGDVMGLAATPSRVYALGAFSAVGAVRTPGGLVALDTATGRVTAFRAPRAGNDAVGDTGFYQSAAVVGPRLLVGGDFGDAGPVRARGFAVLNAETGAPLPSWHPASSRATVLSVTASGARVLVAGEGLGG